MDWGVAEVCTAGLVQTGEEVVAHDDDDWLLSSDVSSVDDLVG